MKQKKDLSLFARTAGMLLGATTVKRTALMLLAVMMTLGTQTAWADNEYYLEYVESDITLYNGDMVTGELTKDVNIFIANGATVRFSCVRISKNTDYGGIICLGDATIIFSGENVIYGGRNCAGIQVAKREGEGDEYTLTLQGEDDDSSLFVVGNGGAGIGSSNDGSCGNIVIKSGTIIATVDSDNDVGAAGIGSGKNGSCGNITISGGIVSAFGDMESAGIGCGEESIKCGDITITSGIVSVTAGNEKRQDVPSSIGVGMNGTCGRVTINGVKDPVCANPITLIGLAVDDDIAEGTAGHYYVNMPKTETNNLMLSKAAVGTVKVYDDGGKSENYSNGCDGTLVITAPEGYFINVKSNSIALKQTSDDYLEIFDNNEASGTMLGSVSGDSYDGSAIDYTSTGNHLTLHFESSDASNDAAGLDLTVALKKKKLYVDVNKPSSGDGKSKETAFNNLQEALNNINDGDIIMIAPGTYTGDENLGFDITKNNLTFKKYDDEGEAIFDAAGEDVLFFNFPEMTSISINIDGLTFKNSTTYGINVNGELCNSFINATFINVGQEYNGGPIHAQSVNDLELTGKFINNAESHVIEIGEGANNLVIHDAIFINNTSILCIGTEVDNLVIHDAIFINNTAEELFAFNSPNPYQISNCWFGNTAENYEVGPTYIGDKTVNDWLFLDATADPEELSIDETSAITFNLYSYDGNSVSDYDASKIDIQLDLTQTLGELNKSVASLGEEITYTAKAGGNGSVTGTIENVSYSVPITNNEIPTTISVNNETLDLLVSETFRIEPTTTPEGLTVTYSADDSGVVSVDENGVVTALKDGTAIVTVSVGGDGVYAVNSTTVSVNVQDKIAYIDETGDTQECTGFRVLTGSETTLDAGWYVVKGNVSKDNGGIIFNSEAHIILADDATLTLSNGTIECNSHLTFFGQTKGNGTLNATKTDGIGISTNSSGNLNINGGIINATGRTKAFNVAGNLVINGGTITGTGTTNDRYGLYVDGTITINGGQVTANRYILSTGDLTINGGQVTATGWIASDGDVTLGWTSGSDYIKASEIGPNYDTNTVSIANGKAFTDGTSVYTSVTSSDALLQALRDVTLRPITGVTLTKDGSGELTATLDPSSEEEVSIPVAVEVDHVEVDRTYVSGKASTVYLPFSIPVTNVSGGKFHTFTRVDESTDPWTVEYTEVTSGDIAANTPYIFLPNGGKITVNNSAKVSVSTANPQTTTQGLWEFIGTYERIKWTHDTTDPEYTAAREAEIGSVYGFAANDSGTDHVGDFVKVGNNVWINPMRAYLKRSTSPGARTMTSDGQAQQLPDKMRVVIISASGETTEIGTLDTRTGEISLDEWYSLDGHKLNGKPTKKGMYINNGRKMIIK
jgi:hypothetical protein